MSQKVKPIPDGYPVMSPSLVVRGGAEALAFYEAVFGAKERMRMPGPGGMILHAELQLGDSVVMLADENLQFGNRAPPTVGGTPVTLSVYVPDVDAVVATAVRRGAKIVRPIENLFYGDRAGTIEDPFGHLWHVATHVEDVSPEETQRRMAAMMPA